MMISVCMITYNQEKYIADAIEGVLMQEATFPFELVIANDASTDNTDSIINDFIKKHPKGNLINYFNHKSNIGMMPNFIFAIEQGQGKYIAMCDGDDYWTDPHKLQKQVDFLEANEEYSISFHSVKIENLIFQVTQNSDRNLKTESTLFDYAVKNYVPTVSALFRNFDKTNFYKWAGKCLIGDYPLFLYIAQYGKIHFINENMAVYRVHSNGTWNRPDYKTSILNLVLTLDIVIENIPQIRNELIVQQYELIKHLTYPNSDLLNNIPKSLINLIDKFEQLKKEHTEINRKYDLLNNSKMVRLIEGIKRVFIK